MGKKDISTLFVTIGLDDKDLVKGVNKFQKTLKELAKPAAVMGAAITAALGFTTKSALDEEVGINRLRTALKNAGADYDTLSGQIEKNIAATQAKTNYGDEEQRAALVELLGITGTYTGALEQLQLATDLAAAKDIDLATAATLVGRVATGNTTMLSRYGIEVKKGATATEALAEMQERFAGSAKGAADPIKQITNLLGDLVQDIGAQLVPLLRSAVERIMPVVQGIRDWITEHPRLTQVLTVSTAAMGILLTAFGTLGMILPVVARGITTVITLLHLQKVAATVTAAAMRLLSLALITNPIGVVIAAVALLAAGIYGLVKLFEKDTESINKNASATRQLTAEQRKLDEAYKKLNEAQRKNEAELTNLQNAYDTTKESNAGMNREIEKTEHALTNTRYELGKAQAALDGIQTSYDDAARQVNEFEQAISDAGRELDKLSNPRLVGMQKYEDQIFAVEQEIKKLELAELEEGESKSRTKKIEELQKQLEILELQRDLEYESVQRQAQEAVETIQGKNEEQAPQDVLDRIAELAQLKTGLEAGLTAATANLDAQTMALNTQKTIVIQLEAEQAKYQARLDEIKNTVENTLWDFKLQILAKEDLIKNTQTEIDLTIQLKTAADKALDGMLQDSILIKDNLADAGLNPVSDKLTVPSYAGWNGPVPGAPGQPQLAVVHGGEVISQPGKTAGQSITNTFHISQLVVREEADIEKIARRLRDMQQKRV
jgi:archaellum component FlaC